MLLHLESRCLLLETLHTISVELCLLEDLLLLHQSFLFRVNLIDLIKKGMLEGGRGGDPLRVVQL